MGSYTFRIDDPLLDAIKATAARRGVTVSGWLRSIARQNIDEIPARLPAPPAARSRAAAAAAAARAYRRRKRTPAGEP